MKNNRKGFTLAELLIVVAIIAVLVAVAIPVFTAQLEKSREATDLSNIRAAYAECSAALLTGSEDSTSGVTYVAADGTTPAQASKTIELGQTQSGWQTDPKTTKVGGYTLEKLGFSPAGTQDQKVTITVYEGEVDGMTWSLGGTTAPATPGEGG